MKWSITYFYNVRHLKRNQLPLSTAMYPPKWYAQSMHSIAFLDNRYVVNGLTLHEFVPALQEECPCKEKDYEKCSFLQKYEAQLEALDFDNVIHSYEKVANDISKILSVEIDEIVLLVFEKPDNHCSEREALKNVFKKHGIELNELEVRK